MSKANDTGLVLTQHRLVMVGGAGGKGALKLASFAHQYWNTRMPSGRAKVFIALMRGMLLGVKTETRTAIRVAGGTSLVAYKLSVCKM
ncbi:MAG TPA: hypothetical protein VED02_01895 [Methyloceanibacter sp.]|nr:hypothetical protein [Methyloceanibacter sp.]